MLSNVPVLNHVEYPVPRSFERVVDLAHNLWWTWHDIGRAMWAVVDPDQWEETHNPIDILHRTERHRWTELESRETVQERYREAVRRFDEYLQAKDTWYQRRGGGLEGPIAYLCTEFGVHNTIPLYSGGLGILAGDHLKSASDLGIPLIGVGLFYRRGYFRQEIDADGDQQHISPVLDAHRLPILPVAAPGGGQLQVEIELPGRSLTVAAWCLAVGRVPLILLDTDIPENDPADRPITHTLYVRGREMRFLQELVLGVGAVRVLEALGVEPAVWHANEGHAALSVIERAAELVESGLSLDEARKTIRSRSVFTLHTPVPAGNETFQRAIPDKYLPAWAARLGVDMAGLGELARSHDPNLFDMEHSPSASRRSSTASRNATARWSPATGRGSSATRPRPSPTASTRRRGWDGAPPACSGVDSGSTGRSISSRTPTSSNSSTPCRARSCGISTRYARRC